MTSMKKLSIVLSLVACLFASLCAAQSVAPAGPMVTYEVTTPSGKTYNIEAPDGTALSELVRAVLEKHPEANFANMQELYQALQNADAAGDTAAAQRLADYIRSIQPSTAAQPSTSTERTSGAFVTDVAATITNQTATPSLPKEAEAMRSVIGSSVGIVMGIVLFWLVAGRRYKHRNDTPNDVCLWWGGMLGGLGLTVMARNFIGENLAILWTPSAWDRVLVTQVVVGTVIAFGLGYCIGWVICKIRGNVGPAKVSSVMDAEVTEVRGKTIVVCPSCGQKCYVPIDKTLEIKCPKCKHTWTQRTASD